jgi:hypothetical protein
MFFFFHISFHYVNSPFHGVDVFFGGGGNSIFQSTVEKEFANYLIEPVVILKT